MNKAMLVQKILGPYLDRGKHYPRPLPEALQDWYCYTIDGGHSILIAAASLYSPDKTPEQFLVPAPVKTVLKKYEQRDGYIIIDLTYDKTLGLIAPPEDEEF